MKRREFLAACAVSPILGADPKRILAAQLYTIRSLLRTEPDRALQAVAAMGFHEVECHSRLTLVTQAARNLSSHPQLKVKLEGNTDGRGTREYNIGLGERRAQAVRRALMLQGVAESQITTVSFGAERPAVEGDDEAAWSQNRRVELNYGSPTGQ